ncbi:MAG: hydrogenase maturation protein HypF, partial [Thermoanaerobacterium sp.]|nr:hydrogenase maturation protein HypF [Thermoanaerobacterium sp.]
GSFQNKYLLENITDKLLKEGFSVYSNSMVPCNDGGIALGQAVIANYKLEV